jgi:hypothetical protein
MTIERFAVSFDREPATAAGKEPASAGLADAARCQLRAEGLLRTIDEWEREHGEITDAELAAVSRRQTGKTRK